MSKRWSDHGWLTIYRYKFAADDLTKLKGTSTRTTNVCWMNLHNYTISYFFIKYLRASTVYQDYCNH